MANRRFNLLGLLNVYKETDKLDSAEVIGELYF